MSAIISVIITLIIITIITRIYVLNGDKIHFFSTGMDKGFKINEIKVLWKLAKKTDLDNPMALYDSVPILNQCISKIITQSRRTASENSPKTQDFLSKLYKYRTRIALDTDGKRGLENTRYLDVGQRISIIYPGNGVFAAKIINNGRELVISMPVQDDKKNRRKLTLTGDEWKGKDISIYLWRKGDAGYAFDTVVLGSGTFGGQACIFVRQSEKLDRTQKRQSVRANCEVYAQMYMLKSDSQDYSTVETSAGYTCLIEDISEDGAMIRIGSKGKSNVRIKLQFMINDELVIMYGVIRAVEYNKILDQSRLHFECTHVDASMKNAILSYVYNVIPEEQKDRDLAIKQSEAAAETESDTPNEDSSSYIDSIGGGFL